MTDPVKTAKATASEKRRQKLAAALKANLKKRKDQARELGSKPTSASQKA